MSRSKAGGSVSGWVEVWPSASGRTVRAVMCLGGGIRAGHSAPAMCHSVAGNVLGWVRVCPSARGSTVRAVTSARRGALST